MKKKYMAPAMEMNEMEPEVLLGLSGRSETGESIIQNGGNTSDIQDPPSGGITADSRSFELDWDF